MGSVPPVQGRKHELGYWHNSAEVGREWYENRERLVLAHGLAWFIC